MRNPIALRVALVRLLLKRILVIALVVGGFGLYLASIVLRWDPPLWVYPLGILGGLALILGAGLRRPRGSARRHELYFSDAYSDAYLGRSEPTHPPVEARGTSQIGSGLPPNPIDLPLEKRRDGTSE